MKINDLTSQYKVAVFGSGSLGANTASILSRRLGDKVGFYLVDYDKIETKNLANQPWDDVNVGQKKISVLAAKLWHTAKCQAICHHKKVTTVGDIDKLQHIWKADVWIDCFDNGKARGLVERASGSIEVIHAGFSETAFKCSFGKSFNITESEEESREPVCDRRDLAVIVQMGASLTVESIYQYLEMKRRNEYYFDLVSGKINCFNL